MFYSIVSIWRVTTTITGRNALTFITGEMLTTSCFSRNVDQLSCHLFGAYTHFYSENSPAATSLGVNLHIFYSENRPAATSLGVNSLPPSVVC